MSETAAETNYPTETPPADTLPPQPSPAPKPKKRSRFGFWFIVLLLALLGAGGWYGQQMWLELQRLRGDLTEQVQQLQQDKQQASQRLEQLEQNREALEQRLVQVDEQYRGLEKSLRQLYALQSQAGDEQDWSVAEVLYLLSAAQQRLLLARDVSGALAALQAADRRLRHFPDPRFLAVREQLAADMRKLRALEQADINGMALRLKQALDNLEQLPLLQGQQSSAETVAEASTPTRTAEGWRDMLGLVWEELRQLVIIRYNDSGDVGLLAPKQRYFLQQNLRLKLENARFALLRGDSAQFHSALADALQWLQRYYDQSNQQVTLLLTDLGAMQTQELAPELPDISQSLNALQALSEESAPAVPPAKDEPQATTDEAVAP